MKVLVTGGYGQLGTALSEKLKHHVLLLTDTDTMDITDKGQIGKVFDDFRPDFLVHGAAYTNVDGCESDPELAERVNTTGTMNLAGACRRHDVKMIYISTDYVFDGTSEVPYRTTDYPNPISTYGRTKLKGEWAVQELALHWIIRTSWVYGSGGNFIRTMLSLSETHDSVSVVRDQWGRPTWANDLARAIASVIELEPEPGIYNVTGDGQNVSWAGLAEKVFAITGKATQVDAITTQEYLNERHGKVIAPRPKHSALDLWKSKQAGLYIADWEKSLREYLS